MRTLRVVNCTAAMLLLFFWGAESTFSRSFELGKSTSYHLMDKDNMIDQDGPKTSGCRGRGGTPALGEFQAHHKSDRNGYGYYWVDSDTNLGVVYHWIEIATIGTRIDDSQWFNDSLPGSRLDDGAAGPFSIGFSFPYCDSTYDSVWVGVNGLLSLQRSDLTLHGYYMADSVEFLIPCFYFPLAIASYHVDVNLDPQVGGSFPGFGSVYIWQNAQRDTFVVQYDSVSLYGLDSSLTMEVIFTLTDSSITFQYQTIADPPYSIALVGIQDKSRAVGLEYYARWAGSTYGGPRPKSGLAIKFRRDALVENNVAVLCTKWGPIREGWVESWVLFASINSFFDIPPVSIFNTGTASQENIDAQRNILEITSYRPPYELSQTAQIDLLDSGDSVEVFAPMLFSRNDRGRFAATFASDAPNDDIAGDDSLTLTPGLVFENFSIDSRWASREPVIDGVLSPGEWPDSSSYDVSYIAHANNLFFPFPPCDLGSAKIRFQNDLSHLYILFEAIADSTLNQQDALAIQVDDNCDSLFAADTSEGRYSITNFSDRDSTFFMPFKPSTSDPHWGSWLPTGSYFTEGFQAAFGYSGSFVIVEVAIPFGQSRESIASAPGRSIGLALFYSNRVDSQTVKQIAMWPSTYLPQVAASFGVVFLTQENYISDQAVDTLSIPSLSFLKTNYPNPFNPATRIEFGLPRRSPVVLKIINILGQVVATLLDQDEPAGVHRLSWDSTDDSGAILPSGIYFCSLRAGEFSATQKMVLLK